MVWWLIGFILIGLVIVIFTANIHVNLSYKHKEDDDLLSVSVNVWAIHMYTFSAPIIKVDPNSASLIMKENKKTAGLNEKKEKKKITLDFIICEINKVEELLKKITGLYRIAKRFLKKVKINKFEWSSRIAAGDAVITGQLVGTIWTIKGGIIGVLSQYMTLKSPPKLRIDPIFQGMFTQTNLTCMISFRAGHAIIASLLIIKHWRKKPVLKNSNQVNEQL